VPFTVKHVFDVAVELGAWDAERAWCSAHADPPALGAKAARQMFYRPHPHTHSVSVGELAATRLARQWSSSRARFCWAEFAAITPDAMPRIQPSARPAMTVSVFDIFYQAPLFGMICPKIVRPRAAGALCSKTRGIELCELLENRAMQPQMEHL